VLSRKSCAVPKSFAFVQNLALFLKLCALSKTWWFSPNCVAWQTCSKRYVKFKAHCFKVSKTNVKYNISYPIKAYWRCNGNEIYIQYNTKIINVVNTGWMIINAQLRTTLVYNSLCFSTYFDVPCYRL
jgi:hypothetical protein